jgi:hypothetical protein
MSVAKSGHTERPGGNDSMALQYRPDPRDGGTVAYGPRLLRRLVVRCPVTGRTADTGFELAAIPEVSNATQLLVDCLECGQDHEWSLDDVSVE